MLLYTDFVASQRGQDYAGWSMVIIMSLNFVINLMVVVKIGASSLGLVVKKYLKIFEKKFITKKEEMPENSSNSKESVIEKTVEKIVEEVENRNKVQKSVKLAVIQEEYSAENSNEQQNEEVKSVEVSPKFLKEISFKPE